MQLKWALLLVVAVVVALFALQNTETVTVRLLFYALDGVSVALVILGTAAATAGTTLVLGISEWLGHKGEMRGLRREIAQRDARIAELTRPAPVITEVPAQIPHRTVEPS